MFQWAKARQEAINILQGEVHLLKIDAPALIGFLFGRWGEQAGEYEHTQDGVGVVLGFPGAGAIIDESMQAEAVIKAAEGSVANIFALAGVRRQTLGGVERERDGRVSLGFLAFHLLDNGSEMGDRVGELFL
jgi:hypothetical protein